MGRSHRAKNHAATTATAAGCKLQALSSVLERARAAPEPKPRWPGAPTCGRDGLEMIEAEVWGRSDFAIGSADASGVSSRARPVSQLSARSSTGGWKIVVSPEPDDNKCVEND